ncbi:MAG: ATP-binding protein [Tessaracoccus sp.]
MSWNADAVKALLESLRIRRGDSTQVEVKRASGGLPENLATTLCAFANMPDGGTILLGIDETDDFAVTGVDNAASMESGVVNQSRAKVVPAPLLRTSTIEVESKQVVVVEVLPLRLVDRPATVDGRAYLRQADGDFVMHEHELRMIEVEKVLISTPQDYDRQVVDGLTMDDLVPELIDDYLKTARQRDRRLAARSDAEILRRTGVLVASGAPTLAGLYALGDYPQGQFPSLTVTTAVQVASENSGARNRDLQHFSGPIPVLLEETMEWCRRNLALVRAYRPDGHMEERPELPLSAVREILANALVHRDLSPNTLGTGKSIQVRLTPTNLFIQSPGGLRGVSIQQLTSEDHAQAAVNQRLYSIAQKLHTSDGFPLIEGEGGGIREVFRSAQEYGLRTPTLINTGVQFKALLWRPASATVRVPARRHDESDRIVTAPVERRSGELSKNEPTVPQLLDLRGDMAFQEPA